MASAEVGDDVYGEDPTVRRLEEQTAQILGKEAALFVPSGTMANQIALQLHCRPSDEVVVGVGSHLVFYEGGAGGAYAGVQFLEVGEDGRFTAEDFTRAIKPEAYYLARTRLVALENTHNRSGGRIFPQTDVERIAEVAASKDIPVHLDGARIWNVAAALGRPESELCGPVSTVSACFSKGLGAPVGSVIAGTADHIKEALRIRRRLGGAMRQAGILCAGALHALQHHRERLAEDHDNARHLASGLNHSKVGVRCDEETVETNIVRFTVEGDAEQYVASAAKNGVLLHALGPHAVRAVTHLGVSRAEIDHALSVLVR